MTGKTSYLKRLRRSSIATYAALEDVWLAKCVVLVLLAVHTGLLGYSAYVHSPTRNEPNHLVAGLSHWEFGRFDLYCVNPPLVKMIAALPVVAVGYNEDWSGFYGEPYARPIFGMGEDFVIANGQRSFFLFMVARWACIPFSWIGAIVCFLWGRDLYGRPAGVFACTIWCFEPNVLAHASLITADAAAAALGVAASYLFWCWLKTPTWTQVAWAGAVLGIAQLAKTTLVLFYPLWPIVWFVYRWLDRRGMCRRRWLREASMVVMSLAISVYVLNLGYGFEGSFKQLEDFHFVSGLFAAEVGADEQPDATSLTSAQQLEPGTPRANRFVGTWLGKLPVPLPKNYIIGIDIQQEDFEDYGRPSYLRGRWRDHGWWYYYVYACAIKVPLALWLLGATAIVTRLIRVSTLTRRGSAGKMKKSDGWAPSSVEPASKGGFQTTTLCDELALLIPASIIFVVVSSKTGFNEHMRYVLPAFPFFFIATSQVVRVVRRDCLTGAVADLYKERRSKWELLCPACEQCMSTVLTLLVKVLGSWLIASSLWIYPHSLSYFNESIGGPVNGPKHLLGSNVDWGQDLRFAKWRLDKNREAGASEAFYAASIGCITPTSVGFTHLRPLGLRSFVFCMDADGIILYGSERAGEILQPGLYIVSANHFHVKPRVTASGCAEEVGDTACGHCENRIRSWSLCGYSLILFSIHN